MLSFLSHFLGRLSVGRKLFLIFLLDMSAVAYVSSILVNEKFLAIDFARKELAGNAYIGELRRPLIASALALAQSRSPNAGTAALIESAQSKFGKGMQSAHPNQEFAAALRLLEAGAVAPRSTQAALDKGRALLTRVGNQSNLILDPDLDSYYTMSIIVLRLPELLQSAAAICAQEMREAGAGGPQVRSTFTLLEGRLDASWNGLASDFGEAIASGRPTLRAALEPVHQRLQEAFEQFRVAARSTDVDSDERLLRRATDRAAAEAPV